MSQKTTPPTSPQVTYATDPVALTKAITAFVIWGLFPVYFKLVNAIDPIEVIYYRVIFAFPTALLYLMWQNRTRQGAQTQSSIFTRLLTSFKQIPDHLRSYSGLYARLFVSGSFIVLNWIFFIIAIQTDRVIETSLGYFISPLITLLFSRLLLKEKLPRLKQLALLIASTAVLLKTIGYETIPTLALMMGTSFSVYALLKKRIQLRYPNQDPSKLFVIEMGLLLPLALLGLYSMKGTFAALFVYTPILQIIIVGLGLVTVSPLLLLNQSIGKLLLSRVGFIQYLTPSISFVLAIVVYREPFSYYDLLIFGLIWCSLFLVGYYDYQSTKKPVTPPVEPIL